LGSDVTHVVYRVLKNEFIIKWMSLIRNGLTIVSDIPCQWNLFSNWVSVFKLLTEAGDISREHAIKSMLLQTKWDFNRLSYHHPRHHTVIFTISCNWPLETLLIKHKTIASPLSILNWHNNKIRRF
jgi:hypothetical protein